MFNNTNTAGMFEVGMELVVNVEAVRCLASMDDGCWAPVIFLIRDCGRVAGGEVGEEAGGLTIVIHLGPYQGLHRTGHC